MKKLLVTAAILALTAGAANAAGLEQGWYLGAGAGWNHADDADFDRAGVTNEVEFDEGWLGNVALGYAWNSGWRSELEGSYRHNSVDGISGTGAAGAAGDFKAWNLMANLFYDFKNSSRWTPYLGAGIGASFQEADDIGNVFAAATRINDKDTQFAYQGIAGIDYWMSAQSALGLRYNYMATTDGKFGATAGTADGEYSNHSVLVTYRYGFSQPAPAPVAPAAAPAVTQKTSSVTYTNPPTQVVNPTAQQVEDSPYKIFFANDSAAINDSGRAVIRDVASRAQGGRIDVVHLTANTDTTGSKAHNEALSKKRAEAVRKALVAQGIAADHINVFSNAERDLPVPTGDQTVEPRNRVVTIVINN